MTRALIVLSLWCVVASNSLADDHLCRFTASPPKIDGAGDDACWKQAAAIDSFGLPWLGDKKRPPKTATKAKLLWDREHLYFLAEMEDTDLYADVKEHDGMTWDNDVFELFFKPADDKPGYYEFQVNAAGTVMDMFLPRRGAGGFKRFIAEGDFNIEAKVKFRGSLNKWSDKDEGWTVEGRIPWRGFLKTGGRPEVGESWALALCRYDYSVDFEGPELSNTNPKSSVGHPDFHRFEDYARVKFEGPKAKPADGAAAGPRPFAADGLPPLTTSRVVGSPDPPPPYRTRKAFPNLKLNHPVCLARQPGSDLFFCIVQPYAYAPTSIIRFRDTPEVSETEPIKPQGNETAYDLCFHPKFADNGYLYVGSNGPGPNGGEKKTRITRYVVDRTAPYKLHLDSATTILDWASDGHNGGAICFGLDGLMYVTTGDGTSDSDRNNKGQGLDHLLAKVLRIDVDRPAQGQQYSVPVDNPFVKLADARPETWAYGFRNPWRIHCDLPTGQLWVGNNGQDLWEQVYLVEKGDNFGWSVKEGSHPFFPLREAGPHPFQPPAAEHSHSESRSLTGGVVYRGEKLPQLRGVYLYGDHSTGKVWGLKHDGVKQTFHQELVDTPFNITCFAYDSHGEVLIADHHGGGQGNFYYLEPAPKEAAPAVPFPTKLSETGLFASVREHRVQPGIIPYSVNSPLWSDGTYKERYLAIPFKAGEERRIDLGANRGWNLPEETVLIKSFALERSTFDSRPRRWIETRLLTKQQGEWVGYSYAWNDEQTDATLVAAAGRDRDFTTDLLGGKPATQTWHYPSRTECMVCHSRAANFVLGPSLLQMNKEHDYGGYVENQLVMLERLGLLRVNYQGDTTQKMREELEQQKWDKKQIDDHLAAATATRNQREAKSSSLLSYPPEAYPRLVDPYDAHEPLEKRARSYLHANCAICHVEAGGGNAKMDLEFTTARDKMNLIDAEPIHDRFGLPNARLVSPGHPESSVLLHRLSLRGRGQMPQLATSRVDEEAVKMMKEWIKGGK